LLGLLGSQMGQNLIVVFNEWQDLLDEERAVLVFLFNPFNFIIYDLEDLIGHDKVVFLPDVYNTFTFDELFVFFRVQVDLDHLQLVVAWLDDVVHVEANALKNASKLEHRVIEELQSRFLLGEKLVLLPRPVDIKQ